MFAKYSRSGLALMGLPLYAGPVLAGWSDAPWALIVALSAIFFLMQLLAGKETTRGPLPLAAFLALLAVTQLVVVCLAYALGSGLAMGFGRLRLAPWVPLAVSGFGAMIGVLRYRHTPQEAALQDVIDQAIDSIETGTPPDFSADHANGPPDHSAPDPDGAAQQALDALWALPDTAPPGQLDEIVQRLEQNVGHRGFRGLLADVGDGNANVDRAILRYAANPRVRAALANTDDLGFAALLLLDSEDEAVLTGLATLTRTLLDENAPASALAPLDALREKARTTPALAALVKPVASVHEKRQDQCG